MIAHTYFLPVKYQLSQAGQLKVFLDHEDQFLSFDKDDFCVAFTERSEMMNHPSESEENILFAEETVRPVYSVCTSDLPEEEQNYEELDSELYPVALFISDFFVFLTLCTYLWMNEFRRNMFGKITIGFLINVFLSYLFTGIHFSLDLKENRDEVLETSWCTCLGLLIQHTWVAVFFWMSAMSLHITRTMLNSFTEHKSDNPRRTLVINVAYAQGSSFIISIVTLIMQHQVKTRKLS